MFFLNNKHGLREIKFNEHIYFEFGKMERISCLLYSLNKKIIPEDENTIKIHKNP